MMKKNLIFILLFFTVWQGYSQSLNYGFGLGLNNSGFVIKNVPEQNPEYKPGFQFNTMLKYNFNDKFGVRIEPGLANRGTIFTSSDYPDTKINLSYLILPVAANYTLFDNFSIFIGPECSYRISAKGKTDDSSSDIKPIYDSKIDVGVIAGFSYQLFDKLEMGFRYNRGFISTIKDFMFTDEYGNSQGKASLLNQGFTLSIAYIIK